MLPKGLLLKNRFCRVPRKNLPVEDFLEAPLCADRDCAVAFKRIKSFLCFYFIITNTFAQFNLVPNPSFELYTTCPDNGAQIYLASPWYEVPYGCTSDYYNGCSNNYGVPSNTAGVGFQFARTGVAYAAIAWQEFSGAREYIQVPLSTALSASNCYYIEFYFNLANFSQLASNNMGCHFSTTAVDTTNTGYWLNLPSHILKYTNPIIIDTINWVQVAGIYTATGGEQYITIGNFFNDSNTVFASTGFGFFSYPYYYIDDVSVIAIDSSKGSSFSYWEYNDTSVYAGDSVFIGHEITGLNCTWYDSLGNVLADSVPGIYVSPATATNYIVVENLCGTIRIDTITVTVNYVGIEEPFGSAQGDKIVVYPNPATGAVTIGGFEKNVSYATIRLTDLQGQEIFNGEVVVKNGMGQLDPERSGDVANGTYLLYIRMEGTNERTVKRIVIQE